MRQVPATDSAQREAGVTGLEMRLSHLLEKEQQIAGLLSENDLHISRHPVNSIVLPPVSVI